MQLTLVSLLIVPEPSQSSFGSNKPLFLEPGIIRFTILAEEPEQSANLMLDEYVERHSWCIWKVGRKNMFSWFIKIKVFWHFHALIEATFSYVFFFYAMTHFS